MVKFNTQSFTLQKCPLSYVYSISKSPPPPQTTTTTNVGPVNITSFHIRCLNNTQFAIQIRLPYPSNLDVRASDMFVEDFSKVLL
jgi:hypothetical protein